MSLILALRGRRARAGESRRSIAPGGYTLDRAHTAHALTLTGALVRRGAVGAETRADETVTEADGPTDAGCRTIRAEESHQSGEPRRELGGPGGRGSGSQGSRTEGGIAAESEACRYIDQKAISQKKNGHA